MGHPNSLLEAQRAWFTDVFGDPDTLDWAYRRELFATARRDYLRGKRHRDSLTEREADELEWLESLDPCAYPAPEE